MEIVKVTAIICLLLLVSSSAFAEDNQTLFIEKCAACHRQGGEAQPVNPADKASIVWEKYFKRGRHRIELSPTISKNELEQVIEYLKEYAADSDRPATAVIPK